MRARREGMTTWRNRQVEIQTRGCPSSPARTPKRSHSASFVSPTKVTSLAPCVTRRCTTSAGSSLNCTRANSRSASSSSASSAAGTSAGPAPSLASGTASLDVDQVGNRGPRLVLRALLLLREHQARIRHVAVADDHLLQLEDVVPLSPRPFCL